MNAHTSTVFGIISGYSFDMDSQTLSIDVSVRLGGYFHPVSFHIPAYGKEYDSFCNRLCLYRKDGTVNLEFLNETYVTATMIGDTGTLIIKEMRLDAIMYQ